MPLNAIARGGGAVDYILGAADIAPVLVRLVDEAASEETQSHVTDADGKEGRQVTTDDGEAIVTRDFAAQEDGARDRQPSIFTCPECGGVLWEIQEGDLLQYRCHVGHEYSMQSMVDGHSETVERALWAATRILEENAALSRRMEQRFAKDGYPHSAERYRERAAEAEHQAHVLRSLLERTAFNGSFDAATLEHATSHASEGA
jgi:two-component system chemotaxis response regulator CheB